MTPTETRPVAVPFYRRRWFLWTAGAIGALVITVCIAVFALLAMWRNSPESALLDALQYAVKTPGVYHVTTSGVDATVTVRDQRYGIKGTLKDVPIEAVLYGGTLSVKSSQPDKLYDLLMANAKTNTQLQAIVRTIAATVKDKWISINLQSTKLQTGEAQSAQCLAQVRDSLANSPQGWQDLQPVYATHRFVQASDPSGNNYSVTLNGQKTVDFLNAFYETDFYQSLTDCGNLKTPTVSLLNKLQVTFSLSKEQTIRSVFVRQPKSALSEERAIQSVIVRQPNQPDIKITANYTDVPSVVVPTDAISLDRLLVRYLQSFTSSL